MIDGSKAMKRVSSSSSFTRHRACSSSIWGQAITYTASPNGISQRRRFDSYKGHDRLRIISMQLARFVPNCHPLPSPHWYHARVSLLRPDTYSQLLCHGVDEMPLSTYPLPKRVRKQRIVSFLVFTLPQKWMVQRLSWRDPLNRLGVQETFEQVECLFNISFVFLTIRQWGDRVSIT